MQGYREKTQKKLTPHDEAVILTAVVENPAIYLHELKYHLQQSTGTDISTASICKLLPISHIRNYHLDHSREVTSYEQNSRLK